MIITALQIKSSHWFEFNEKTMNFNFVAETLNKLFIILSKACYCTDPLSEKF
jgi:hypothetical protein